MIRFALACDKGHDFESWFRDGQAYEAQSAGGLLSCPVCGSARVEKAVMAPQVARKDRQEAGTQVPAPAGENLALMSPEQAQIRAKLRQLRELMTRDSDYVGNRFAAEARRIHLGETEQRAIHGEADREEVRGLLEDGIEVLPIPGLPDDRN